MHALKREPKTICAFDRKPIQYRNLCSAFSLTYGPSYKISAHIFSPPLSFLIFSSPPIYLNQIYT